MVERSSRAIGVAAAAWDPSYETEHVDWYSEYVARHAPISLSWIQNPSGSSASGKERRMWRNDAKGMGLLRDWTSTRRDKVVAPLEDGKVCVWDLNSSAIVGMSVPGILSKDIYRRTGTPKPMLDFANVGESVSVDSLRQRAYLAVGNILNEVDVATLQVITQQRYPWTIFALSQESDYSAPLTVATTLSMQMYDSRLSAAAEEEAISLRCEQCLGLPAESRAFSLSPSPLLRKCGRRIRIDMPLREDGNYASLFQPAPLSILHPPAPCVNNILLAGRFPSILCYDRRFFPRLQKAVHSGGRLCALTSVASTQFPWASSSCPDSHKVVACGGYNGCGTIELYDLKRVTSSSTPQATTHDDVLNMSFSMSPVIQNRQNAAKSKVLSVQPHATRIAFSDTDGNIKWFERDGRSEVRRFNINNPNHWSSATRAAVARGGEARLNEVARRILPTGGPDEAGGDLLVWTGDRIGRVRFCDDGGGQDDDAMSTDDEEGIGSDLERRSRRREEKQREREYEGAMRRALERQADEVRWIGRLGMV